MKTSTNLDVMLREIDHKSYPAYKSLRGIYAFGPYALSIDHVQGDPFASPSKVSVHMKGGIAGFPKELYCGDCQRTALQDYLTRQFHRAAESYAFKAKGSGKSGLISISRCGQEILERTAFHMDAKTGDIVARLEIGFPANGRTINARELEKILFDFLPDCVERSLYYRTCDKKKVRGAIDLAEDQEYIRGQLEVQGLTAFVANGSILPRESGISPRPMKGAVPFRSPKELEVTMELPHKGTLTGMGIRKGITLIVGGGYHGKSTLLKALELGVYDHIAGDGREYVITDASAVKIRAEDGRSIKKTDISMFINDLPNGKDTCGFYTEDASGSTSQAANVVEAMEAGAKALLIDEDTSATNFMIRDELMQRVIHRDMEPITPFIERMGAIYERFGISTVLVAGSSGAYFQVADKIVQMDRYVPRDITEAAKEAAAEYPGLSYPQDGTPAPEYVRKPKKNPGVFHKGRIKIKTMGRDGVQLGHDTVDLRYVEQLADSEQLTCLGYILKLMEEDGFDGKKTVQEQIGSLLAQIEKKGFAAIVGKEVRNQGDIPGNLAMPRREEIFACMNRYRGLKL